MKPFDRDNSGLSVFQGEHRYIERPRYFCSFGGGLCTVEALPETVAVLHAAGGCGGNIAWGQNGGAALQVGGFCGGLAVPSSNIGEREVIFGGGQRLAEQIRSTVEMMEAKLFVVITSCVTEMIGDDVQGVVNEVRESLRGAELAFARTGGFKGNSYHGYDLVMSALARQVVRGGPAVKGTVNVFGVAPYLDPFWRGNLEGIRGLLEGVGLRVNTFFGDGDSLEGLYRSGEAELNIVVSDMYGLETARVYEECFGTPYISGSLPIGPGASGELLRRVAAEIEVPVEVETVIREETGRYWRGMGLLADGYYDLDLQRYALIIGDVNYAVALTRFVRDELGWIPVMVQFTELLDAGERERLAGTLREAGEEYGAPAPLVVFDTNASEAGKYLLKGGLRGRGERYDEGVGPLFVIGSSLERELAGKLGAGQLSVSFPVSNRVVISRGYTGFGGGLTLAEDLLSAVIAGR